VPSGELRAGIPEGTWTPCAAKQATWGVAPVPPKEGEALCALLGNRTPSNSPLDRWPTALSASGETPRPHCEATLRPQETLPVEAVALAVSHAGVMAPRQDGARHAQRTQAVAAGKTPRGPAGSQEVGGATGSYDERAGHRLLTRRMARRPETNNRTLKSQLTAEVRGAWIHQPALRVVTVAEGVADTWSALGELRPFGEEGRDCSHAVTHLGDALGAAYGAGAPQ